MRIIKYYDRIHSELLELEVNDEVAKFFHADNRRWSRQGQNIKETYSEEYYYYCTKTQRVLKPKILQALLQMFDEQHADRLDFLDCYEYLKLF